MVNIFVLQILTEMLIISWGNFPSFLRTGLTRLRIENIFMTSYFFSQMAFQKNGTTFEREYKNLGLRETLLT